MKRIIKDGDVFVFCDDRGNIPQENADGYGLYCRDTRYLSRLEWELEGIPVLMLSGSSRGARSRYRYTNREVTSDGGVKLWRESLEIVRERWIDGGAVYERFRLTNLDRRPIRTFLTVRVDADFADMFAVRGFLNGRSGRKEPVSVSGSGLLFAYRGVDGVTRRTEIHAAAGAEVEAPGRIRIPIDLKPGAWLSFRLVITPAEGDQQVEILDDETSLRRVKEREADWRKNCLEVETDSPHLQAMTETSLADLRMLMTDAGDGDLPVAGLPWFAVPFGRDSLIAALQTLPVRPELAEAAIRTMARHQGAKVDPWRDEEPGKIMHEIRFGELARSGQVPFTPYYGTIDATPLFLILIAETWRFTGNLDLVREFAGHARRAFDWIDRYGDAGRTGYTSYARKSEKGIDNQGWKDSGDSVMHRDGRLAEAPIALSEVQGYVYLARVRWAELFRLLGDEEAANRLLRQAEDLKRRFVRDFWMEDEQFVALALDKSGAQVGSLSSNPGHLLMTGILDDEQARKVACRLMADDLFSGWGIRTLSTLTVSYNPMSYHNGSVWPHDNSLILLGLADLGFRSEAERLMEGLIAAAARFPDHRLPELFCGYAREEGEPVPYPVACSPQAWAAGTAFVLIRAMLGLRPEPREKRVVLSPVLPEGVNRLTVRRLRIGGGMLDLTLVKAGGNVHVSVQRNTSGWSVVVHPAKAS